MTELGRKSLGVLELTALPSIDKERWVSWVREADVLLVNGGDPLYLCHSIFPHLDSPDCPENTMAEAERWAAGIKGPAYATDPQTAIKVTGGGIEVVSEGQWKLFNPAS
jgi:dipeptidase E